MTGTLRTPASSSADFDVDALLADYLQRATPLAAAAKPATDEVDVLLTRALQEIGLASLIHDPEPTLSPSPLDESHTTEARTGFTIVSEPLPDQLRRIKAASRVARSRRHRTLFDLIPTPDGVYALERSNIWQFARALGRRLGGIREKVSGLWLALGIVALTGTATFAVWVMVARPIRPDSPQTLAAPAEAPAPFLPRLETERSGSDTLANSRAGQPLETTAAAATIDAALRNVRRSRPTSGTSDRTAARATQKPTAPVAAIPAPRAATTATPPPTQPQSVEARSAPEVAQPAIASQATPPVPSNPTERGIQTNPPVSEPRLAEAAPSVPSASPDVSGRTVAIRRQPPTIISRVDPVYPNFARRSRIEGTVQVQFTLDEGGLVVDVSATSGPAVLRAAAEAAVRQWRFTPALMNGVAQAGSGTVSVVFSLK